MPTRLSDSERAVLLAIAEVATPAGRLLRPPDGALADDVVAFVDALGPGAWSTYRSLVRALDLAGVGIAGKRLSSLAPSRRAEVLERLAAGEATFWWVRAVTTPIKAVRASAPELAAGLGNDSRGLAPTHGLTVAREVRAWERQLVDARTLTEDEVLEVDVVVVGSGAGGAPIAKVLAERGYAVVVLEEGGHFTRADFAGRPLDRQRRLYRDGGLTTTFGNTVIPVFMGRTVGGSTTVNSGTCYRAPASTLRRWQVEHGLFELGPGSLDAHYARVEAMLHVDTAEPSTLGGCAETIARGAEALGWRHGPLRRNAPGCDGRGECCFGCPTDAKRSTNVSYLPRALERGAMLYANAKMERVLVEGGRAVGVVARVGTRELPRRLEVRARAVVLACGTLHTPALLLAQGLANSSGRVGRGLTIHPASYAWAELDRPVRGWEAIPQGYAIDEFADQGLRFEGAFLPLSMAAATMSAHGTRWTQTVERFDRLACFGFMIEETSRGSVHLVAGKARMTYVLEREDVRRIVHAQGLLARAFFAGGADVVRPGLRRFEELRDLSDVERLEREGPDVVRARDLDLSAYHPLGTCQMGPDAKRSVIGPTQECWDVPGLFVCDGSAVPGPLGVNPQLTIMALSERAADFVAARVDRGSRSRSVEPAGAHLRFAETMRGTMELASGETIEVSFSVEARGAGGTFALAGTIDAPGIASGSRCLGTLAMRPDRREGTLVYDLDFEGDDGAAYTLHGEKHTRSARRLWRGMTTLHSELRADGALVARGALTFDRAQLPTFLASFGWRPAAA